jgi:predicted metal-binding protein
MTCEVIVCEGCGGAALADAFDAALDIAVRRTPCMNVCDDPVTVAFKADGKATYLFAGITPDDVADAQAFVQLYKDSPDGWIEDARQIGRMRLCLKGRIPV